MMNQNIGVLEEELRKRTADYILARRNEDGGYTSVQFTDSNARDTFMALATLKELEVKPPYIEQTTEWLKGLPLTNLCSIYYVNKSLWILGQPLVDVVEILDDLRNEDGGYGTLEIDVESTSELDTTLMSVELLKMLNKCFDQEKTKSFVLRLKNQDGGFGKNGESNLISTYHALKILNLLSDGIEDGKLDDVTDYILKCRNRDGGFASKPEVEPAYMESTYAGFMSLKLLGISLNEPNKIIGFVLSCMNSNGGFRRSIEHGISSFENTYYAISILKELIG